MEGLTARMTIDVGTVGSLGASNDHQRGGAFYGFQLSGGAGLRSCLVSLQGPAADQMIRLVELAYLNRWTLTVGLRPENPELVEAVGLQQPPPHP